MRRRPPKAYPGMKIGLFGGSFDPAHAGHAHVAETALKRLNFDRVWWLVSPQNPLKPKSSPIAQRLHSAQAHARGARMEVTDIEARFGWAYTYQTLRGLRRRYPRVQFWLIVGADTLASFRRWRNWREIASSTPVAVVSREGAGARLRLGAPPGWVFLNARHHPQSSTAARTSKPAPVTKTRRK